MNKKYITAACLVSMMLAAPAFAADAALAAPAVAPRASSAPPSKDQQQMQSDRKAEDAMRFDDHKKEMLKSLSDRISEYQSRIAEMQKTQECIKTANDAHAMHACFPDNGHGWHHGDGKWGHHEHDGDHTAPAQSPVAPH